MSEQEGTENYLTKEELDGLYEAIESISVRNGECTLTFKKMSDMISRPYVCERVDRQHRLTFNVNEKEVISQIITNSYGPSALRKTVRNIMSPTDE